MRIVPRRIAPVLAVVLLAAAMPALAYHVKDSEWKTGTLTNIETANFGRPGPWGRFGQMRYTIDAGDTLIYAIRTMSPSDRPLIVTLHSTVRYAFHDEHIYLADDTGKQHQLILERKVLKSSRDEDRQ